jgi:NADPH2:quinone reductase
VDEGEIAAGKTVLVTGASGGVGTAAVQLAKALGARVVALSRSVEKRGKLRALGANLTFDSADPDLVKTIQRALDGGRVDIVVENLGGPFLQRGIELVGPHGRIAVVGLLAGLTSEIQIGSLLFKRVRIAGISVGDYTPAEAQAAWAKVVETLDRAGTRPVVDRVFAFAQVQEAFAHLARGPMGKVIVAAPARGGQ